MLDPLPNFDRSLGFVVSDISRLLRKEFERRVRGEGLTLAQWLLLYHVARQPNASQSDLAESLQLEKITISRHAARLEKRAWLERHSPGALEERTFWLRLTPRAIQVIRRLSKVVEELKADAFRGFSEERRVGLVDDLLQVKTNLLRLSETASGSVLARQKAGLVKMGEPFLAQRD